MCLGALKDRQNMRAHRANIIFQEIRWMAKAACILHLSFSPWFAVVLFYDNLFGRRLTQAAKSKEKIPSLVLTEKHDMLHDEMNQWLTG
jgi:hypothetical protein